MFICKQHLRIIALSFYSVKQKTGVFYKKIKFFVYFDISFYLSKSTGQTLPWNTIYRNVRAYARACARVCMRVNIIRIFRFLFFRQTVFLGFFEKAVLKQDCNNARFFRLFLSCKRFIILSIILQADYSPQSCKRIIKLSIILRRQDFTRRRRISSPRDFIKKAPFAFCEGGALFFY